MVSPTDRDALPAWDEVNLATSSASSLMTNAGLAAHGPVTWKDAVRCTAPGVYVVETPEPLDTAPLDDDAIDAWITRVSTIRVDGELPSIGTLRDRLAHFWVPSETIVYVGLAGTNLHDRVRDFYDTPLGDPRPHAGGHWLKTLSILAALKVWWAGTDDPAAAEATLLAAFAEQHGGGLSLPFANRETTAKVRKPHGITGSTLPRTSRRSLAVAADSSRRTAAAVSASLVAINEAIQRLACASPDLEVTAVEAARELDQVGLLKDSSTRPGLPLRNLLRAGKIDHAYLKGGHWWFIRCAGYESADPTP